MSLSVFGRSLVRGMQYSFLLKRGTSHRRELSPVYLWKTQVSTRSWQSCRLDTWMWSGPKFVSKSVYYASFTFCFLLLIKPPFSARSTRLYLIARNWSPKNLQHGKIQSYIFFLLLIAWVNWWSISHHISLWSLIETLSKFWSLMQAML